MNEFRWVVPKDCLRFEFAIRGNDRVSPLDAVVCDQEGVVERMEVDETFIDCKILHIGRRNLDETVVDQLTKHGI